jgi:hypothetical protein
MLRTQDTLRGRGRIGPKRNLECTRPSGPAIATAAAIVWDQPVERLTRAPAPAAAAAAASADNIVGESNAFVAAGALINGRVATAASAATIVARAGIATVERLSRIKRIRDRARLARPKAVAVAVDGATVGGGGRGVLLEGEEAGVEGRQGHEAEEAWGTDRTHARSTIMQAWVSRFE